MKGKAQEIVAAGAVVLVLIGVPTLTWWYENNSFRARYGADATIFKLTASAQQGRLTESLVGGYNYWSGKFPRLETLRVNTGERVVLVIKSADVTHSFRITPELAVEQPIEMEGGHTRVVDFVAEEPGTYFGECTSFCGYAHHGMFFDIEVSDKEPSAHEKGASY